MRDDTTMEVSGNTETKQGKAHSVRERVLGFLIVYFCLSITIISCVSKPPSIPDSVWSRSYMREWDYWNTNTNRKKPDTKELCRYVKNYGDRLQKWELNKAYIRAIECEDWDLLALVSKLIPETATLSPTSYTPLSFAIAFGRERAVFWMLHHGQFDPNIRNATNSSITPLELAAALYFGKKSTVNYRLVEKLLYYGADPTLSSVKGVYPFQLPYEYYLKSYAWGYAANTNREWDELTKNVTPFSDIWDYREARWRETSRLLFDAAIKRSGRDTGKMVCALLGSEVAQAEPSIESIEYALSMLDVPLSIEQEGEILRKSLNGYSLKPERTIKILQYLVGREFHIDAKNPTDGRSVLHQILWSDFIWELSGMNVSANAQKVAKAAISLGADIDSVDAKGMPVIAHLMLGGRMTRALSFVLSSGASMDIVDDRGFTPLHYASDMVFKRAISCLCRDGDLQFTANIAEGAAFIRELKDAMEFGMLRATATAWQGSGSSVSMSETYGMNSYGFYGDSNREPAYVSSLPIFFLRKEDGVASILQKSFGGQMLQAQIDQLPAERKSQLYDASTGKINEEIKAAFDTQMFQSYVTPFSARVLQAMKLIQSSYEGDYPAGSTPIEIATLSGKALFSFAEQIYPRETALAFGLHLTQILIDLDEMEKIALGGESS